MAAEKQRKMKGKRREIAYLAPERIFVKDFGPVGEADIELGKITILMGPNNTGKTYTSVLTLVIDNLLDAISVIGAIMDLDYAKYSQSILSDVLTSLYTVNEPRELVRHNSDKAVLRFILRKEEALLKDTYEIEVIIDKSGDISVKLPRMGDLFKERKIYRLSRLIYIPAERAGIMRTYKQLLRLYLQTRWAFVPQKHRERIAKMLGAEIRLPGVVEVLLDHILGIEKFTQDERAKSTVSQALEILEEEVLRGRLEMSEDLSVTYYDRSERPIDLINASSMVSEISAIYLLSKRLRSGGWLVIEEPESHVHPRGQMGLARFMAMLARNGVNVVALSLIHI